MGRKRINPEERKEFVGIRLPGWLINKIKQEGSLQNIIEGIASIAKHDKER